MIKREMTMKRKATTLRTKRAKKIKNGGDDEKKEKFENLSDDQKRNDNKKKNEPTDKKAKDYVDPTWGVMEVCNFLKEKEISIDWVERESIDGMAYQTLDMKLLHENWKVATYGTCVKILSFQQWPSIKTNNASPLVPTPDMMRRQSLSYWGVADVPPSEKIVAKAKPPDATELVDRIIANRTRREENLHERMEKKKTKETTVKILEREKSGRGFKYLISFNNGTPKWTTRSLIPRRFIPLVEQFDEAWEEAVVLSNDPNNKQNMDDEDFYYDNEDEYHYDEFDDDVNNYDDEINEDNDDFLNDIGLSRPKQ